MTSLQLVQNAGQEMVAAASQGHSSKLTPQILSVVPYSLKEHLEQRSETMINSGIK